MFSKIPLQTIGSSGMIIVPHQFLTNLSVMLLNFQWVVTEAMIEPLILTAATQALKVVD